MNREIKGLCSVLIRPIGNGLETINGKTEQRSEKLLHFGAERKWIYSDAAGEPPRMGLRRSLSDQRQVTDVRRRSPCGQKELVPAASINRKPRKNTSG